MKNTNKPQQDRMEQFSLPNASQDIAAHSANFVQPAHSSNHTLLEHACLVSISQRMPTTIEKDK